MAREDSEKAPNWKRLRQLQAELEELAEAGKLDEASYRRIRAEAEVASGDFREGLESFANFAPHPAEPAGLVEVTDADLA